MKTLPELVRAVIGTPMPMTPSSAQYFPAAKTIEDAVISNDPATRLAQLDSFYRRNPGYAATSGALDGIRELAAKTPGFERLEAVFSPTELGYGQLIHDQMVWQNRSLRQPDNEWWMGMNSHLVQDPLQAEALVRSGAKLEDAPNPAVAAWMKYVQASDAVATRLNLPAGEGWVTNKAGVLQPTALSDVSRGAGLLDRVVARTKLMPQARRELWNAHMATLDHHLPSHAKDLASVQQRLPNEAKFGPAWANAVGYLSKLNPMATGRAAVIAQRFLPATQRMDPSTEPLATRAVAEVIESLPTLRRDTN